MTQEGFIPKHGGYEKLLSYQKAKIVYDGTVYFCEHFIDKFSRARGSPQEKSRTIRGHR